MIVSTDYVFDSGKGTSMFSKNGRLTNFQYKVFTDPPDDKAKMQRLRERALKKSD